ncbi:MAG: nucleotidyl transferase AbiEii/AbiGii toxin family protein [Rhizobacter sp.]|nr:nucleotidyl transferase AbiEii/AbiGii toxin family protein [Chlorobiales bacterium]
MMNHLKDLLVSLAQAKVKFVVCGGVAVVLHGVERMTLDLDIVLEMTTENLERLLATLKALSLVPRAPVPPELLLDMEKVKWLREEKHAVAFNFIDLQNPFRQVDILLTEQPSYDALLTDAETLIIGETEVKIISKAKLIAMKQAVVPVRLKDLADIEALQKSKPSQS